MKDPLRSDGIRFGVFEFDPRAEELRKNGTKIRLRGQPFQVLAMLLERPGEVVTREELQQRLWPDGTFVDFDHSLNTAINKIREVLGDSAENPRFVETLARRGYCFIAPVDEVGRTVQQEKDAPEITMPADSRSQPTIPGKEEGERESPRRKKLTSLIWLATGAAVVAGSAGWFYLHHPSSPAQLPPMKVSRFTSYPGRERDPALSPDRKQLAFAWDGERRDNFDIYVQLIGGEKPLQLTNDPRPDVSPTWSPDGRFIAFARIAEGSSGVYLVPSLGGHERQLTEAYSIASEGRVLDWSPDGKFLVAAARLLPEDPDSLFLISVETGKKRRLTWPPIPTEDGSPAFSNDGQALTFTRGIAFSDVYVLPVGGGQPKRLTFNNLSHDSGWTPDDREVIFCLESGDSRKLWRVSASGGKPEPLEVGTNGTAVSCRGHRLAYEERLYDTDIWRIEAPEFQGKRSTPTKLVSSSQWDDSPQYSPDGTRIVFGSDRSGNYETWICDSDGRNPRQLTSFPETWTGSARWSSDGRFIVFDSWARDVSNIFVVSAEGGSPRRLTDESGDGFVPSWSKDGRWIYFCSKRSGSMQIWKMPANGGQAVRITKNGGFEASEGTDGNLYYSILDGLNPAFGSARIWKISIHGGEETLVLDKPIYPRYWALADRGIYFVPSDWSHHLVIELFSFSSARVTEVVHLNKPPVGNGFPGFSVSPDGRWILCALLERDTSDIMLVENFR